MGKISADTFKPLNNYVSVRMQQGVPIADSDWNELDDIRRFELRTFVRSFIGDGCPIGSDAFRITAPAQGMANSFLIRGSVRSTAPQSSGRILVDGLDVTLFDDISYDAQTLVNASPQVLLRQGAQRPLLPLATPTADGTLCVYLDVWEHLITVTEEPRLLFRDLGEETCARTERRFAVRTRAGSAAPAAGDSDHEADHGYYALATISRRRDDPSILPADITDLRALDLSILRPRAVTDALQVQLGSYRRGQGRPNLSLREAANALLAGTLPGMRVLRLPAQPQLAQPLLDDDANVILQPSVDPLGNAPWQGSLLRISRTAGRVDTVTDLGNPLSDPSLRVQGYLPLPQGEFLAVYIQVTLTGGPRLFVRRGTPQALGGAAALDVSSATIAPTAIDRVDAIRSQNSVVLLRRLAGGGLDFFRYQLASNTVTAGGAISGSGSARITSLQYASAADGTVYAAYVEKRAFFSDDVVHLVRIPPSGTASETAALQSRSNIGDMSIAIDSRGDVWVAGSANGNFDLRVWQFISTKQQWSDTRHFDISGFRSTMVSDRAGALWVFHPVRPSAAIPGAFIDYVVSDTAARTATEDRHLLYLPSPIDSVQGVALPDSQIGLVARTAQATFFCRFYTGV